MVRKPKRKRTPRVRRTHMIVFYVISILVVISMAIGLALSVSNRNAPEPSSLLPLIYLL